MTKGFSGSPANKVSQKALKNRSHFFTTRISKFIDLIRKRLTCSHKPTFGILQMPVKMDVNLCKRHMKRLLEAYRGGAWRQKSSLVAATMEELEKVDVLLNKCSTSSEDFRQGRLVQMDGYSLREDRKPVTRCIVASCSSSDMQGNYNEVPRFFHVPILAEARDEYVRVIGVPANRISKNSKICDRHFTAEDFNERGKLRKGVFPSLELPEW